MATAAKITSDITPDGTTVLLIDGEPIGQLFPVAHRASGRVAWSGHSQDGRMEFSAFSEGSVKLNLLMHAFGDPIQRVQS